MARLIEIADLLDERETKYSVTLDGNEQFDDVSNISELLDRIAGNPRLNRFNESILFIEQPISRSLALEVDVTKLGARKPVIMDESDDLLDSFPKGRELGYRGVS